MTVVNTASPNELDTLLMILDKAEAWLANSSGTDSIEAVWAGICAKDMLK